MFCKTIILSNSENLNSNAPKGILTLSKDVNGIKGKIRLYNLTSLPAGTKIGLYVNEKVHITSVTKKPQHYEFDLNENIDITQSIYCALIDNTYNDKKVVLEGGSFNGFYFTDSPFDAILEAEDKELDATINKAIKQEDDCENCNCSNCEYKKYFYSSNSNNDTSSQDMSLNLPNPPQQPLTSEDVTSIDKTDDINSSENINNFVSNIQDNNIISNSNKEENLDNISSLDTMNHSQQDLSNKSDMVDEADINQVDLNNETNNTDDRNLFQNSVIDKLQQEIIDDIYDISPLEHEIEKHINHLTQSVSDLANEQLPVPEQTIDNNLDEPALSATKDKDNFQTNFLNEIIYQLDEMLKTYPEDDVLNSIIPNSKFVRVDCGNPYVLGVIYEDKHLKFIAYGVPATYNSLPPTDLGQHYQWLPLNPHDVMSDGYFMIYQDAVTGSVVKIDFEE